ncbi:MAG TPA: carbonic anhydrase [Dehalococcoidia bacterium]|nr:carbonic anhydrase [Dehalococcoidia bacterium]
MSELPQLLAANKVYAASFSKGSLPMPPGRKLAILVCMDARLDPARFLGLEEGDVHVIRNAGGRASPDALRSLIISHKLLGTREFLVIHHTDCGMVTFSNQQLQDQLKRDYNADASDIDFLPFSDLKESVRQDVQTIRSSPFIPKDIPISGFIYDIKTGRLEEVK